MKIKRITQIKIDSGYGIYEYKVTSSSGCVLADLIPIKYIKDFKNFIEEIQESRIDKKMVKLQKELEQQRFNNKHNLSIDQKIADKIKEQNQIIKDQQNKIERLTERF